MSQKILAAVLSILMMVAFMPAVAFGGEGNGQDLFDEMTGRMECGCISSSGFLEYDPVLWYLIQDETT